MDGNDRMIIFKERIGLQEGERCLLSWCNACCGDCLTCVASIGDIRDTNDMMIRSGGSNMVAMGN